MKSNFPKKLMATDTDGQQVRGFAVLVESPSHRPIHMPCTGDPWYTGEQAIDIMRAWSKGRPNFTISAVTHCPEGYEKSTLAEMLELYPHKAT